MVPATQLEPWRVACSDRGMSDRMNQEELLERVMGRGVPDRGMAEVALRSALLTLGQRLTRDEAHALAARLPTGLALLVEVTEHDPDLHADALYSRMQLREKTTLGVAREHLDIVVRALGETLDEELCGRLARALPEELAQRLARPERGEPPPHADARHAPAVSTLAHGRPGSRHPVSESAPPAGHAHSVAVNADPHGETKLSSAQGLTQERFGETLATGKPPAPERPVSDTSDD